MRNKYFGDIRDLFKFDLALWIASSTFKRMTYVPMLTKPDRKKHTGKYDYETARAGWQNHELIRLLRACVIGMDGHSKDIREIVPYFQANGIEIAAYKDDDHLTVKSRYTYWDDLAATMLPDSLVLVDPNTGMENSNPTEDHLLHTELEALLGGLTENSILMLYQHFPMFFSHEKFLASRSDDLNKCVGHSPLYITDNEIIFFFMARSAESEARVKGPLGHYNERYPRLATNCVGSTL